LNRESLNRESGGGGDIMSGNPLASTFEDMEVYQVAREFRKSMYQIARNLPEIEKFVLAPQVRRAALSVTNNIAEGHGRYHYLDQIKFMLASLKQHGWRVRQLIDGYVRYLRIQKASSVRECPEDEDDVTSLD
jgi:four helix bundle protein